MNTRNIRVCLQVIALAGVVSVGALNSGCVAVVAAGAAGAGTVAWVEGKLVVTVDGTYEAVLHAADQSIAQLQFLKLSDSRDALTATLEARTAEDKKVVVDVKREGDHLTKVEIRVGTFGDKAVSQAIYDKIRANL